MYPCHDLEMDMPHLSASKHLLMQGPQALIDSKLHCHVRDVLQQGWHQTLHGSPLSFADPSSAFFCICDEFRHEIKAAQLWLLPALLHVKTGLSVHQAAC